MNFIKKGQILWLLVLFLLWGMAIHFSEYAKNNDDRFRIHYQDKTIVQKDFITALNYEKIRLGYDIPIRLINYYENESVTTLDMDEDASVTVTETYTNMLQVIPFPLIAGELLSSGDIDGCLIDKESAFHLFGTSQATGNKIQWKGRNYIVRGVTDTKERLMLVYEPNTNQKYQYIEMINKREQTTPELNNKLHKNYAEYFLMMYDFGKPICIIDGYKISTFMSNLCKLPAILILLLFVLIKCRRWYFSWKSKYSNLPKEDNLYWFRYKLRSYGYLLAIVVYIIIGGLSLLLISGIHLRMIKEDFPNGWSNMKSYWYGINNTLDNIHQLNNIRLFFQENELRNHIYLCILCIAITLVILIYCLLIRKRSICYSEHFHKFNKFLEMIFAKIIFLQAILIILIILMSYVILYCFNYDFHAPAYYLYLLSSYFVLEAIEKIIYNRLSSRSTIKAL